MGLSPSKALPTATNTYREWSVLLLPHQLQLFWFSASIAALAVWLLV